MLLQKSLRALFHAHLQLSSDMTGIHVVMSAYIICVVPGDIHTPHMVGKWKFQEEGGCQS